MGYHQHRGHIVDKWDKNWEHDLKAVNAIVVPDGLINRVPG